MPQTARGLDAPAVIARVRAGNADCQSYSAQVRLEYFRNGDRFKGTARIFAQRPNRLRYEVQGPHGGVLSAFATDGKSLAALDMGTNRLTAGSATAAHFDTLLPVAPLGLDAAGWVALMFGDINVPDTATLAYNERNGLFELSWQQGAYTMRAGIDPESFVARQVVALLGKTEAWRATPGPRDAHHLPTTMRLHAGNGVDVGLRWRDVEAPANLVDAMFELPRPAGVAVQNLEP